MNVISPSRNPHNVTRDFLPAIYETLCYFNATTFIESDSEHYNCWSKSFKSPSIIFCKQGSLFGKFEGFKYILFQG